MSDNIRTRYEKMSKAQLIAEIEVLQEHIAAMENLEDLSLTAGAIQKAQAVVDFNGRNMSHCQGIELDESEQTEEEECDGSASEKMLDNFFNLSLDLFCVAGFDGYFKKLNIYWKDLLGYSLEELTEKPYLEFVYPGDREATLAAAAQLTEGKAIVAFENRYLCKDGNLCWLSWKAAMDQKEEMIYAVARDVTSDRALKAQLVYEKNKFEAIFKYQPDAVVFADKERRIVLCNAKMTEVFGYEPKELFHKPTAVLYKEKTDFEKQGRLRYNPNAAEELMFYEIEYRRKNGDVFIGETAGTAVKDAQGETLGYLGIIRDITRRKEMERAVEMQKYYIRSLYEVAASGVEQLDEAFEKTLHIGTLALDMDMGIISQIRNNIYEVMHLYMPHDSVVKGQKFNLGKTYCALTLRESDVLSINEMKNSQYASHPCYEEFQLESYIGIRLLVGGKVYGTLNFSSVSPRKFPFHELDLDFLRLMGRWVSAMIEYRQVVHSLEEKTEAVSRSNAEIELFSMIASRDLREPLRTIGNFSELLSERYKGMLDEKLDKYINYIVSGTNRMKKLLNELLSYSNIREPDQPLKPVDSMDVLKVAMRNIEVDIRKYRVRITHDKLPVVFADRLQLVQLYQHLLTNAIQFRSDREIQIHIGVERESSHWLFYVKDNGIGIDPVFHKQVFYLFRQLNPQSDHNGKGVGLSICKKCIENHGGEIWVESQPGEGTTFYFTIPIFGHMK